MKCILCAGTGWVCEWHLSKPWEGPGACGCGGAGTNCTCNPEGQVDDSDWLYLASVDPEKQAAITATNEALKKAVK
jgi:hypothetical protein